MEITLEQIDLIRKRANVSYKEAKEALVKGEGNLVEALAYLEEENRLKPEKEYFKDTGFFKKIKGIFAKLNRIKFVITKNDSTILNISLLLALVLTFITFPLAVALIILALVTSCKIRLTKNSGEEYCSINNSIDNITNKVSNFADKVAEEIKNV